jgi:hypothetical protein
MDNKVIGNKSNDNKDPKNQQKAQASTQKGIVPNQKATYFRPQNSPISTHASVGQEGDAGVKMQEKRQQKIIRSQTSYSDGAIARAKALRGA